MTSTLTDWTRSMPERQQTIDRQPTHVWPVCRGNVPFREPQLESKRRCAQVMTRKRAAMPTDEVTRAPVQPGAAASDMRLLA
jgi:hypothetical protein